MPAANTADIGIAIRDLLEHKGFEILDWDSGDPAANPSHGQAFVEFIDVGDPSNLTIYTDEGTFRVSIIKEG